MSHLHDLLGFVGEVLLNLIVGELEDLKLVGESRLRRLSLCEVVYNLLVRIGLFDVGIVEINNRVAVWEGFALHTVVEDNFLLATGVDSLDLAVVANDLVYDLGVRKRLSVVLLGELQSKVFLFPNLPSPTSRSDLAAVGGIRRFISLLLILLLIPAIIDLVCFLFVQVLLAIALLVILVLFLLFVHWVDTLRICFVTIHHILLPLSFIIFHVLLVLRSTHVVTRFSLLMLRLIL